MKTQINLRLGIDEKSSWKEAAGTGDLSDWVRTTCNRQAKIDIALRRGTSEVSVEHSPDAAPKKKTPLRVW